ncbi:adenosylcobinamide-GDP ribazoletransferase [Rhodospirillum rubrum]|uniref:Adenosylcobinamide-GDP ribazoletransferase n=1 Tax=Rhodospirillum rubrum (strain ATCC 11170 / ATH 1.1.1 / DSM 467 / LMG 4362 / NCIMB 8255 / S1) TaxID=269796 RepID=Q2RWM3_RHORT|nr:adenosylcobinamide-GDP ribazoletransferase [Rhodospirillum rubrum]ABC21472.1 cobalamin-5'-phosphate synthase [Rhodospirillum rubrum ATCC 11170]AEO47154.1 cobalamin-5'-phosphate synthase [Rhodospirillum rubrum F11]MBK5953067.1 adenosylcobinamide-GDP ribazoletransferase [Rhodospirillum rubrum]QXG81147.1 adenosylcobinamide-GDP ribazoletransferase [Rhodospirillum rubrum]HAP99669.1 adenosylcobinamide-GDP ribazoletransferase [Rhodospirillum rubrum]
MTDQTKPSWTADRGADLLGALFFLTRLPTPTTHTPPPFTRAVWAFPLAGALVGLIGALAVGGAQALGLSPTLAALLGVSVMALVTGAMHEDAVADIADGFGGGRTRERVLEIMRDSRVGAFGVTALVLVLALRVAALAALAGGPWAMAALVCAAGLGRGAAVLMLGLLPPARTDGLGASFGRPQQASLAFALILCLVLAVVLLPGAAPAVALVGMVAPTLYLAWRAKVRIGGQTGDVAGAAALIGETLALVGLSAMLGAAP